jgi:large subunit ribosomal protein L5
VLDTIQKSRARSRSCQKARKSVANFKLRAGMENSAMVTIRRDRMWHFLDRLINLATPRIKDFRGLNRNAFDRQGNYSIGLPSRACSPRSTWPRCTFTHGMHINFTFRNSNPEKSRFVLEQMGCPSPRPTRSGPARPRSPSPSHPSPRPSPKLSPKRRQAGD